MRLEGENSEKACFLRGDYEHVYWFCADLYDHGIVVMDSKEDYYLVDDNLKKTYLGCNHPKDEKEDMMYVMPRLGKRCYNKEMLRMKKQEEKDLQQLHEKSKTGNVELYQAGKKWGVKVDGKVTVPPIYLKIMQPVGVYCAFEQIPNHWGVMTLNGKVMVEALYDKVEIRKNNTAIVTTITGKTQEIALR